MSRHDAALICEILAKFETYYRISTKRDNDPKIEIKFLVVRRRNVGFVETVRVFGNGELWSEMTASAYVGYIHKSFPAEARVLRMCLETIEGREWYRGEW